MAALIVGHIPDGVDLRSGITPVAVPLDTLDVELGIVYVLGKIAPADDRPPIQSLAMIG